MVYARSLMNGQGFRFYPTAPPTLGTTTPLETIVLAVSWKALPFLPPETVVIAFSVLCWLASGWLLAFGGETLGFSRTEAFCAGFFVLIAVSIEPYHLGMETRLFTLLLTLSAILYAQKRFVWAGVASGLLFLTRGEGVLILGAFAVYELLLWRSNPTRQRFLALVKQGGYVALGFLFVFVPWAIYALSVFGTFISDTLAAKTLQIGLGILAPFPIWLVASFVSRWSGLGILTVNDLSISVWSILSVIGIGNKAFRLRPYQILLLWSIAFVIGYLSSLVVEIGHRLRNDRKHAIALHYAVLGVLLTLAGLKAVDSVNELTRPFLDARWDGYANVSRWLQTHTASDSRIGYIEMGFLGWNANRQIIDLLGLTNPELIPALASGGLPGSFQMAHPDYFIYNRMFSKLLNTITQSSYFIKNYRLVATVESLNPVDVPESLIYGRVADYF
ncbi:MAG: hypothetical protein ACYDBJ_09120 [Aggregatilineales bacterium]